MSFHLQQNKKESRGVGQQTGRPGDAASCDSGSVSPTHVEYSGADAVDVGVVEDVEALGNQLDLEALIDGNVFRHAWIERNGARQIKSVASQARHAVREAVRIVVEVRAHRSGIGLAGLRGEDSAEFPAP